MATVEAASPVPSSPAPTPSAGSNAGPAATTETPSSSPSGQSPPAKKGPDPAKVKAILDHAKKGAPASDAASPPTDSSKEAADGKSGAADAKSTDSSKSSKETDGDPELAKRLARVARAEDSLRALKAEAEPLKGELVEYRAWKEARGKDPVAAALHGLTDDQQDALYWHLNKAILDKDPSKPADPAELARKAAREEWERLDKEKREGAAKQADEALERERAAFVDGSARLFAATPAKWPGIAALGVTPGDIVSHVEAEFTRTGDIPDAAAVLDHFERKFAAAIEAQGYTRQKIEAQPGGEKPRSETLTSEWSAGSVPASTNGEMTIHESREAIKRKHFKR